VAVSFIDGGNRRTREKTTNLLQVTDKLHHIMLYQTDHHDITEILSNTINLYKPARAIQHYVMKFVSDLQQVGGFLPGYCIKYILPWAGFEFKMLVVIGTDNDCTGSCKSNYCTITTSLLCIYIYKHKINHSIISMAIQHYVMKFVSDLQQVGGFLPGSPVSSINKTDCHDIAEILLKVVLNTINLNINLYIFKVFNLC
jgi:hypothetical protein